MKKILLLFILSNLFSCKMMIIKMMIKNPKVENTQSIKRFQEKNKYSTKNSLILNADTSNAAQKLFKGMISGYYIFDKDGNQMCYNSESTCQGEQFRELINNEVNKF